jgi:hypothetical protein
MKESHPTRRDAGVPAGKGQIPRKETREVRPAVLHEEPCPVIVRYYGRMRLQRVYPLTVTVAEGSRRPGSGAGSLLVTIQPVIPGAYVVPAEQALDGSIPGGQATFHVTPLARSRLSGACVQVRQPGRPAQSVPLRMKVTTQTLTWVLLALTILAPISLRWIARNPLTGEVFDVAPVTADPHAPKAPDAPAPQAPKQKAELGGDSNRRAEAPVRNEAEPAVDALPPAELVPAPQPAEPTEAAVRAQPLAPLLILLQPMPGRGQGKGEPKKGGGPPAGFDGFGGAVRQDGQVEGVTQGPKKRRAGTPDEVLRDRFRSWVHTTLPEIPHVTPLLASSAYDLEFTEDRKRPEEGQTGEREVVYNDLASYVSWLYEWTLVLSQEGLPLYAGAVLFGLTVVSWVTHGAARRSGRQTLVLAAPITDAGADTLALSGTQD